MLFLIFISFSIFPFVIQTTGGRKNLGGIHFVLPRFFATLRSALNDN